MAQCTLDITHGQNCPPFDTTWTVTVKSVGTTGGFINASTPGAVIDTYVTTDPDAFMSFTDAGLNTALVVGSSINADITFEQTLLPEDIEICVSSSSPCGDRPDQCDTMEATLPVAFWGNSSTRNVDGSLGSNGNADDNSVWASGGTFSATQYYRTGDYASDVTSGTALLRIELNDTGDFIVVSQSIGSLWTGASVVSSSGLFTGNEAAVIAELSGTASSGSTLTVNKKNIWNTIGDIYNPEEWTISINVISSEGLISANSDNYTNLSTSVEFASLSLGHTRQNNPNNSSWMKRYTEDGNINDNWCSDGTIDVIARIVKGVGVGGVIPEGSFTNACAPQTMPTIPVVGNQWVEIENINSNFFDKFSGGVIEGFYLGVVFVTGFSAIRLYSQILTKPTEQSTWVRDINFCYAYSLGGLGGVSNIQNIVASIGATPIYNVPDWNVSVNGTGCQVVTNVDFSTFGYGLHSIDTIFNITVQLSPLSYNTGDGAKESFNWLLAITGY